MNKVIVCGKFDNIVTDYSQIKKLLGVSAFEKVRIGSRRNAVKNPEPIIAATNGEYFFYDEGKDYVNEFLSEHKNIVVLTIKEKLLVIDRCLNENTRITAFEEIFPIFDKIKYISNPIKSLAYLITLVDNVISLGFNLSSMALQLSNSYQYKVERKLRSKSLLDSIFYFSYKPGYQEVFKLKEERNKKIIALDFNSMFLDCMKGKFPDPRHLEYADFERCLSDIEYLHVGTYSVVLKRANNEIFNKIHPFKYVTKNRSMHFNLFFQDEIHLDLLDCEIHFYRLFFDEIYVKYGVFSKKTISHPLLKEGLAEFANKNSYSVDDYRRALAKQKIVLMHSCTNRKFYKKKKFKTISDLTLFINKNFFIDTSLLKSANSVYVFIQSYSAIFPSLKKVNDFYVLEYLNYYSYNNVYSLSSRVLANSRVKMIKTVLKIMEYKSTELCYCNIDSIHVSVNERDFDGFMSFIEPMISQDLGKLKVEAIATRGYWFDLGRFWLFDKNEVVKFSNSGIKNNVVYDVFSDKRKITNISKIYGEYYSYDRYISLYKLFSLKKKITFSGDERDVDNIDFFRYDINVDLYDFYMNSLNSVSIKKSLFKRISTV